MVNNADAVVAYVIYGFGGACETLRYAEKKNKQIELYWKQTGNGHCLRQT